MLRELTKSDWLRIFAIPEDRIPDALILRGTRNLKTQYKISRERFDDVIDLGSPTVLIEDLLIGQLNGRDVAYAAVYGAAMASEVTHLFGVLGTKLVLQTGCCGAWAEGILAGDLFIPTRARCGEGAAQYYIGEKPVVSATVDVAVTDSNDRQSVFRGGIYTTAALFAESQSEIDRWAADGWDAVDMETATTFAVAEHFGMDAAAILYVFDNPRRAADIVLSDDEKVERREAGNSAMMEQSFQFVARHLPRPDAISR